MPPGTGEEGQIDYLLDQMKVPTVVQGAALALGIQGLVTLALGIQNLLLVNWRGLYAVVPLAMVLLGAGAGAVAVKLMRGRAWALGAALGTSVALLLGSGLWFVVMIFSGLISLLGLMVVGAGALALLVLIIAIQPFQRLVAVRRRLKEAGYDVDL